MVSYTKNAGDNRLEAIISGGTTLEYGYNPRSLLEFIQSPTSRYNFVYNTFGAVENVQVGTQTLIEHTYASRNGNLLSSEYGNGVIVSYTYDDLDRVTAVAYNGVDKYKWSFNAYGQVGRHEDLENSKTYSYQYDLIGRLLRTSVSDGSYIEAGYNNIDLATGTEMKYGGEVQSVLYRYSSRDNAVTLPGTQTLTNNYDLQGRLEKAKFEFYYKRQEDFKKFA